MRKIAFFIVLITGIASAQFFESEQGTSTEETNFSSHNTTAPESPDQGVEGGPAAPGDDVPIDKWGFLLPILGMLIGIYYLNRKKSIVRN